MKTIITLLLITLVLITGCSIESSENALTDTPTQEISQSAAGTESIDIEDKITFDDVAMHDSYEDCWVIVTDKVYDITQFIDLHKGGDHIVESCGRDATDEFLTKHEANSKKVLEEYEIGNLI